MATLSQSNTQRNDTHHNNSLHIVPLCCAIILNVVRLSVVTLLGTALHFHPNVIFRGEIKGLLVLNSNAYPLTLFLKCASETQHSSLLLKVVIYSRREVLLE
jgi:hypothetical protein